MERNSRQGTRRYQQQSSGYVRYLNRQGDWLEKTRGHLLVAATVIGNMGFQLIINPPGGVWQSDNCGASKDQNSGCKGMVGTSVLEHHPLKRRYYTGMVSTSLVSFCASMSLILLVISAFRLRNRLIMGIMVMFMIVAVLCTSAAFCFTVLLVHHEDETINQMLKIYIGFWVVSFLFQLS